jgi:hypothetical protein
LSGAAIKTVRQLDDAIEGGAFSLSPGIGPDGTTAMANLTFIIQHPYAR